MGSHGKLETEKLRKYLEAQLDRLVQQLEDIEELRNEMKEEAYEYAMELTKEELVGFNECLQRMISGDTTLIDELSGIQLAIKAAINKEFKTPAVIRLFGRRETSELKQRLLQVHCDMKLGKLSKEAGDRQCCELLNALRQLGEKLEPSELQLLEKMKSINIDTTDYVQVNESTEKGKMAMAIVGDEVKVTQNT